MRWRRHSDRHADKVCHEDRRLPRVRIRRALYSFASLLKALPMSAIFHKLNLRDEPALLVLNAPPSFEPELGLLVDRQIQRSLDEAGSPTFVLAFVTRLAEVEALAAALLPSLVGDAKLWFAYPKQSSKRYRCDFHRDTGWQTLEAAGFESVRMVAIDEDWSALRFRRSAYVKTAKV